MASAKLRCESFRSISAGTEMLFALGLGRQVVAVSHECDWPPECRELPRASRSNVNSAAASGEIDQQVRDVAFGAASRCTKSIGELLANLQPDLIVTQAQCDVCAVPYADVHAGRAGRSRLEQHASDCTESAVAERCARRHAANWREPARCQIAAKKLSPTCGGESKRFGDATARLPHADRPRTAIIEWTDPLMLAGNWVPEMIELAGGQCELTPRGEHSRCIRLGRIAAIRSASDRRLPVRI